MRVRHFGGLCLPLGVARALKGLKRLLKNGKFTGAKSAHDIRIQYERSADVIKAFFSDRCETSIDAFVTKADLWEAFYEYCKKYSVPNPYTGMKDFGKRVSKTYTGTPKNIGGKTLRVWTGIKLQEEGSCVNYVSNSSLKSLERSKSVERITEKRKKRNKRNEQVNIEEMFRDEKK